MTFRQGRNLMVAAFLLVKPGRAHAELNAQMVAIVPDWPDTLD
jgi:hypothetical protein